MPSSAPDLDLAVRPEVTPFFDEATNTLSYVVRDPASAACAVVDSVLNLDYPSGSISFSGAEQIVRFIRDSGLKLEWILETHVHADHLSAALYIRQQLGGRIAIGADITGSGLENSDAGGLIIARACRGGIVISTIPENNTAYNERTKYETAFAKHLGILL